MLRGIYGDPERYQDTYWSRYGDRYFAGDGCKLDDDGYLWLLGRVDDVMNVSGHRISTTEVESRWSTTRRWPRPPWSAPTTPSPARRSWPTSSCGRHRARQPSSARSCASTWPRRSVPRPPKTVIFTDELPKTRSGKIMRRLLRDVAEGRELGDTTTLADAVVVDEIRKRAAEHPQED
jgi:acetyl-CoA synthetase